MPRWRIDLLSDGRIATLHHDDVAALLKPLGPMTMQRLSNVEFDEQHQDWTVWPLTDRIPAALWPAMVRTYARRTDAIAHEIATLTQMSDSYGELL